MNSPCPISAKRRRNERAHAARSFLRIDPYFRGRRYYCPMMLNEIDERYRTFSGAIVRCPSEKM